MWSDRRSESELLISVSVKEKLRKSFAVLSLGAISLMTLHFSAQILIHLLLLHHFCRFKFQIQIHVHAASHKSKTIDWIIASCQKFFSQKMTYLHLLHNIIIIISDNNNNNFPSGQWSWLSWQRGRFRCQRSAVQIRPLANSKMNMVLIVNSYITRVAIMSPEEGQWWQ